MSTPLDTSLVSSQASTSGASPENGSAPGTAWFVMRDLKRANALMPAYRQLGEAGFEVFTPMAERIITRGGRRVREMAPLIHDLLFVRSTRERLDPVVARTDTLQYRFVKGGGYCQPLTVPAADMARFIGAVRTCATPVYYRPEEIQPSMCGRPIRIIGDTPLNGYEGRLLATPRSRKRRVLVELPGLLVAAVEVRPDFIQLL